MEYRAHQIGADYSIKPALSGGTIVSVVLPKKLVTVKLESIQE